MKARGAGELRSAAKFLASYAASKHGVQTGMVFSVNLLDQPKRSH